LVGGFDDTQAVEVINDILAHLNYRERTDGRKCQSPAAADQGYQNIFLRRGFGVYLIDQPRRGNAGRGTQPMSLTPMPSTKSG
jgi:hypothetical protein